MLKDRKLGPVIPSPDRRGSMFIHEEEKVRCDECGCLIKGRGYFIVCTFRGVIDAMFCGKCIDPNHWKWEG